MKILTQFDFTKGVISNIPEPSASSSPTTKGYVDGLWYQGYVVKTSSYTLVGEDHKLWLACTTNNLTITLPNGLPTGFQVVIDRQGTQTVTVSAATTLLGKSVVSNSVSIANRWGVVHCGHTGSNIWRITGDL